MIERTRLQTLLESYQGLAIGLVGDLFLDRYLEIDPRFSECSVETGLPAWQVTRVRNSPGALGTVMNNLAALGIGRLVPVSVVGDDGHAHDLLAELAGLESVDPAHIIRDPDRLTPTYTKPMRQGADGAWRELNRIDLRNCRPLAARVLKQLLDRIDQVFAATAGLIVVDQVNEQGWGVVGSAVREHLAKLARGRPDKLLFIDSRAHIGHFRHGVLKPNVSECLAALGRQAPAGQRLHDPAWASAAACDLARHTGCPLFCTLGDAGMLVVGFEANAAGPARGPLAAIHVGCDRVEGPVDPVGAGDSATAGIVASLLAGASAVEAASLGNLVASITVRQLGTTGTATPADLLAAAR